MEEKVQKIQEKRVLAQEKAEELRDKEKRKMVTILYILIFISLKLARLSKEETVCGRT